MHRITTIRIRSFFYALSLLTLAPLMAHAADDSVSPYAYDLFTIGGFPVTNAMVTSWVISLCLILAVRIMVGKPQLVPGKGQAAVENIVTGVRDLIAPIVGKHMVKPSLPLLAGLFTFILIHNLSGLIPGVSTFGFYDSHGHFNYWFRPGNADLNMTLALAVVHFFAWAYLVMRYAGPKMLLWDVFGNKADKQDVGTFMWFALIPVFLFVGVIEVISIAFRNVSLPFRLFGNVFAGENLLTGMLNTGMQLHPIVAGIINVPFYMLETLVGVVQALVFTLLVAVYIGLICNHGDEEHAH